MKLSISLPTEEIAFMDGYARSQGIKSRSGVIKAALRNLRTSELSDSYASAWRDFDEEEDRVWDRSSSDGLPS
ncbi:MAG: ribbon-helix-helix domain-containing protein [Gammaproteobacteria bacterium]|nr:ribbon-helix-helix domain-containing protein [Gammaproteobacteria bacterium]